MHALGAVDDLRDVQIDNNTRQRERVSALEAELALHQVEHRRHRMLGGEIEILVEAERDPRAGAARDRRAQLEIAELERHAAKPVASARFYDIPAESILDAAGKQRNLNL